MPETNARIKVCHDTAANFKTNNPTLLVGEWALETDTKKMKIGDGSTAYNALPYSTAEDTDWVKPADWVDIRSGALPNSIYLLVAHSVPTESEGTYTVATYPQLHIRCGLSNTSHTYDVYVDGNKVATTLHYTTTVLDWGELYTQGKVSTIYETSHPSDLVTHVVRLTPSDNTDTLTVFQNSTNSSNTQQGILWAHYELSNPIRLASAFGGESRPRNLLLEAITAKDDKIIYSISSNLSASGLYLAFAFCESLVKLPILEAEGTTYPSGDYACFKNVKVKKIIIKNNKGTENFFRSIHNAEVRELYIENGTLTNNSASSPTTLNTHSLKQLPLLNNSNDNVSFFANNLNSLENTIFDDGSNKYRKILRFFGTSNYPTIGLKGLTVSNEAPFDYESSPQIKLDYTGLSRAALVNLFKSMPYNVGYTVVGTPNIVGGVVSGFSENNYLQFWNANFPLTSMKTYEASVKFTTENTMSVNQGIIGSLNYGSSSFGLRCSSYNRITSVFRYKKSSDGTIANVEIQIPDFLAQANTTYYGKMSWNLLTGAYYIGVSTDNISFYEISGTLEDYDSPQERNWLLGIGKVQDDQYFRGSIDLNETYIKVDGVTFFNGAATRQLSSDMTVVGSPSVSNGVATNLSYSNYYESSQEITYNYNDSVKMRFKFKTPSSFEGNWANIVSWLSSNDPIISLYSMSSLNIRPLFYANKGQINIVYDFALNTEYVIELEGSSGEWTANLKQNDTVVATGTLTATEGSVDNVVYIGRKYRSTSPGIANLDFNDSFIIVNGSAVIRGTQPMTKTCSVVGCTGTADLTADDKAIATGKGWELTVA